MAIPLQLLLLCGGAAIWWLLSLSAPLKAMLLLVWGLAVAILWAHATSLVVLKVDDPFRPSFLGPLVGALLLELLSFLFVSKGLNLMVDRVSASIRTLGRQCCCAALWLTAWRAILLAGLLPSLHGCQVVGVTPVRLSSGEQRLVDALWRHHETSLVRVLEGAERGEYQLYSAGGEAFEAALDFFEAATGIESNTGTTFGRLITPELGETLALWRSWYRENRLLLRFDPAHCEVQVQ